MVKKSIEVSSQCQLDIILIIFDRRQNRYKEVHTSRDFTMDNLMGLLVKNNDDTATSQLKQALNYKRQYARDVVEIDDDENAVETEKENNSKDKIDSEK